MKNKFIIIIIINLIFSNMTLDEIYLKLNIDKKRIQTQIIPEEKELISIGLNSLGKEIFLSNNCAKAWGEMEKSARKDSIQISILSGFRSYYKQYTIIQHKLNKGQLLGSILKENKLPGLSEHHSGNAIDIISNSYKLSQSFENSLAYAWLIKNAHKYGFYMTYPKNNDEGIMFEPWHWYFKE